MKRFISVSVVAVLLFSFASLTRAGDPKDATAVVDKAIKAMGGEQKLTAIKAGSWKAKGKINFGGNESDFAMEVTFQGLDHFRQDFEGDFGGNKIKGILVLAGDKAWRKFGDMTTEIEKDAINNEKRNVYLQIIPVTLVPLKAKGFKLALAADEKVGDKQAAVVNVTPPVGESFKIYFDKETSLPVKVAAKVKRFGMEFMQETTFKNYKDFKGVQKSTSIESKRDGEKFMEIQVTEFSVLDKVDPKLFTSPD